MFTDNRKEELEITESELKDVENAVFNDTNTSLEIEEIQDSGDVITTSHIFYSNQSNYNMEGESLW